MEPGIDSPRRRSGFRPDLHVMRAIAIVMVVAAHSADPVGYWPVASAVRHYATYLHMPVFFFLAGYFGVRLLRQGGSRNLGMAGEPVRRLILPYLVWSVIAAGAKFAPGPGLFDRPLTLGELLPAVLVYPSNNPLISLWFLYALALLQLGLLLVHQLVAINYRSPLQAGAVLLVAVAISELPGRSGMPIFALGAVQKHLPYFMAGLVVNFNRDRLARVPPALQIVAVAAVVAGALAGGLAGARVFWLYAAAGVVATWLAAKLIAARGGPARGAAMLIADHAFEIYLMSVFAQTAARWVLVGVLDAPAWAVFAGMTAAGMVAPLLAARLVLERSAPLRAVLLGSWRPAPRRRAPGDKQALAAPAARGRKAQPARARADTAIADGAAGGATEP